MKSKTTRKYENNKKSKTTRKYETNENTKTTRKYETNENTKTTRLTDLLRSSITFCTVSYMLQAAVKQFDLPLTQNAVYFMLVSISYKSC